MDSFVVDPAGEYQASACKQFDKLFMRPSRRKYDSIRDVPYQLEMRGAVAGRR